MGCSMDIQSEQRPLSPGVFERMKEKEQTYEFIKIHNQIISECDIVDVSDSEDNTHDDKNFNQINNKIDCEGT